MPCTVCSCRHRSSRSRPVDRLPDGRGWPVQGSRIVAVCIRTGHAALGAHRAACADAGVTQSGDRDADRLGSEDTVTQVIEISRAGDAVLRLGVGHQEARGAGKPGQWIRSAHLTSNFTAVAVVAGGVTAMILNLTTGWLLAFTVKLLISYVKLVAPAGTLGLFGVALIVTW